LCLLLRIGCRTVLVLVLVRVLVLVLVRVHQDGVAGAVAILQTPDPARVATSTMAQIETAESLQPYSLATCPITSAKGIFPKLSNVVGH